MLRKYKEEDRDDLIDVWFAASKIATPFLSDEFLAAERDNIAEIYLPNAETWVVEIEDAVVGFTSLIGNEVGAIFVRPDLHGKGIGTTLMDHAVELRKSVFLDVFKENTLGRRFYDRYGFQIEREHVHGDTGHCLLRLVYSR